MMKLNTSIVVSAIVLIASPAFAKPDISIVLTSKKLVEVKGKPQLVDSAKANPGDVLVYSLKLWNKGTTGAAKLQPVGNIPPNTVYIPEKNDSKEYKILYSIDKGKSYSEHPVIKVKEKGKVVEKNAPVEMYNKIKWSFSNVFAPKKTFELNYKVKVK
jgi:uncharacterized repeat protein (TIGR01451 family)